MHEFVDNSIKSVIIIKNLSNANFILTMVKFFFSSNEESTLIQAKDQTSRHY